MRTRNNIEHLRSLSEIFSAPSFKKIAAENCLTSFRRKIKAHYPNHPESVSQTISGLYKQLEISYRNEYIYKNTILNKLILKKYSLNSTVVLNEFRIGNSIADLVLLNGRIRVFEIKSDLDGLDKLDKQIADYRKFATQIYIVANEKNTFKLIERYENTAIGIIELSDSKKLRVHQEAKDENSSLDHVTIFKTLRKQEYIDLIRAYSGTIPNVPNTIFHRTCLEIVRTMDIQTFQSLALKKLKERRLFCPQLLISKRTPEELKYICCSLNLTEPEYYNLFSALTQNV